jgi:hypothetical protein
MWTTRKLGRKILPPEFVLTSMITFELRHRVTGYKVTAELLSRSVNIIDDNTVSMTLKMDLTGIDESTRARVFRTHGVAMPIVAVTSDGPKMLVSDRNPEKDGEWFVMRVHGNGSGLMDSAVAAWFAQ